MCIFHFSCSISLPYYRLLEQPRECHCEQPPTVSGTLSGLMSSLVCIIVSGLVSVHMSGLMSSLKSGLISVLMSSLVSVIVSSLVSGLVIRLVSGQYQLGSNLLPSRLFRNSARIHYTVL